MRLLVQLGKKKTKLAVGLMSGTSLDGIDAALLRVSGTGLGTKFKLLAFETYSFPRGLREFILKNSSPETSRVDDLCRLNTLVGKLYADAVKKNCPQGPY